VLGRSLWTSVAALALAGALAAPAGAQGPVLPPAPPVTGGVQYGPAAVPAVPAQPAAPAQPVLPGLVAQLANGMAYAPDQAPDAVKQAIWAANEIVGMPYRYGGGHELDFTDVGYDCSGTVSFALHGAGLLAVPRDSSSFARFGLPGKGQWITIYTNPAHAFAVIAGVRLDTSAAGDPAGGSGPRWRPSLRSTRGYRARHPVGL
jgi:cell wall-associated NlpC family hydrolase